MESGEIVRYASEIVSIVGTIGTFILAFNAIRASKAAKISAEIAEKSFATAMRPFAYVDWTNVILRISETPQDARPTRRGSISARGRVYECSGVPVTLHSVRYRIRFRGAAPSKQPFSDIGVVLPEGGALLYGEKLYASFYPVIPVDLDEFPMQGPNVVDVEFAISGPDGREERWLTSGFARTSLVPSSAEPGEYEIHIENYAAPRRLTWEC